MEYRRFENLQVGDGCNDADCKFPAGIVRDVGSNWFTVEWDRGGIRYNADHWREALDSGRLIAWGTK